MSTNNTGFESPYGPGFQLISCVTKINPEIGEAVVLYQFTGKEKWLASDHFPVRKVMPGVRIINLMVECALQSIVFENHSNKLKSVLLLDALSDIRFLCAVNPGDKLKISAKVGDVLCSHSTAECEVRNQEDKVVAKGFLIFNTEGEVISEEGTSEAEFCYTGTEVWTPEPGFMEHEMVLEAMCQAAQSGQRLENMENKLFLFLGVKSAVFHRIVYADTILVLQTEIEWLEDKVGIRGIAHCQASDEDGIYAETDIMFGIKRNHRPQKTAD